jgi:hypothetical protein
VRSRIIAAACQQAVTYEGRGGRYIGRIVESSHGQRVAELYAKEGNRR